jgi:endonuclease YncB( thermonuclease family)
VSHVYDGDTVRLTDGRKVRLIGINTPEIGHGGAPSDPLGEEARRALQKLLAGQERIALRYDSEREDHYGRVLAHLYLADRRSVQERMLEQGLAAAVAIAPNLANLDCYLAAEARAKGRGIWQQQRFSAYESDRLPRTARGFYIVQGTVGRIGESRKSLWLNFSDKGGGKVAVRIDKGDLPYFERLLDPKQLRGKKIRVRGWLSEWRGELQMRIYHPAALQRLP